MELILSLLIPPLIGLLWHLRWRICSPVVTRVCKLYYQDVTSSAGDVLHIITPHPRRYQVEVEVNNRSKKTIRVREMVLVIGGGKPLRLEFRSDAIRLEPGDSPRFLPVSFPWEENHEAMAEGSFRLVVVLAKGRAARFKGRFPLK